MHKRIRTGLVSVALAGGTVLGATQIGSVANAQEDTTTDTTVVEQSDVGDEQEDGRRHNRGVALASVAELLGVEADELRAELRGGATLADVAAANGVDTQAVVDLIVVERTEQIEAAVDAERITQEQADEKLADLEEGVTTRVEEGRPEGQRGPRGNRRAAFGGVADLLGVEAPALRTELRGGSTLAEVAAINGVETQAVVDLIVTERTERLDRAVENGRMTAEEAAERLDGLEEQVATRVEQGRPDADG